MKRPVSRAALSTIAALVVVVVALFVQDRRHGWPFSRHHDLPIARSQHGIDASGGGSFGDTASDRVPFELSSLDIERLGVRFEQPTRDAIENPVRSVATIVADESRITHVHARVAGWLEQLYVNTTGQHVRAGEKLAAIFSQELYSSQLELVSALEQSEKGPSSEVLNAARTRLELLGMSRAEIDQLEKSRVAKRLVTISAPRSGVVLNRGVSAGTAVDPSTEIVTLADLSVVWVIAEVAEGDAASVRVGGPVVLDFPMARREPLSAKVELIYPTLTERTRTVRVRIPIANGDGMLRPGLYGTAEFPAAARQALTVPRDAVVDTGESQHVFVRTPEDVVEPRAIKVGARLADRVEVIEGLTTDDLVVTTGVFLLDSESRLRASGTTGHAAHGSRREETETVGRTTAERIDAKDHAHDEPDT
jgi:Cu(I)/Ag(I) efflux system membrane fusion protein